jgi:hypothetical protein
VDKDIMNHWSSTLATSRVNHTKISEVTFELPPPQSNFIHFACPDWLQYSNFFAHIQQQELMSFKVKVKLSLCLIKHHAMKTYRDSGGMSPPFLTSAFDGREWSASRSGRFYWELQKFARKQHVYIFIKLYLRIIYICIIYLYRHI